MVLWFVALLGIVQGLTEFIPVSSSAHLRLVAALLGQPDAGAAYTAVLQLGTLIAVLAYFGKDLLALLRAAVTAPTQREARLLWQLGLATVPLAVAGLALESHIIGDLRRLEVVSSALLVVGFILIFVDRRGGRERTLASLGWGDALLIGVAQAAAVVPGVSRSGATICMALVLGLSRTEAARFSFLLSIPAVAGTGVFEVKDAIVQMEKLGSDPWLALVIGTVISGVVGYASIAWFLHWLSTRRLTIFGVYRIALGALVLAAVLSGALRNEDHEAGPASSPRAQPHVKNSPTSAAPTVRVLVGSGSPVLEGFSDEDCAYRLSLGRMGTGADAVDRAESGKRADHVPTGQDRP
jgi:undecaprenyl-diphosphatase